MTFVHMGETILIENPALPIDKAGRGVVIDWTKRCQDSEPSFPVFCYNHSFKKTIHESLCVLVISLLYDSDSSSFLIGSGSLFIHSNIYE